MLGRKIGLAAFAILIICSMPMASGVQNVARAKLETNGVPADSALAAEQSDRMTPTLETDAFDTKDIVAASGWIESAHIADW